MVFFLGNCNFCDDCLFEYGELCRMFEKVRLSIDVIGIEISLLVEIDFLESVFYGMVMVE